LVSGLDIGNFRYLQQVNRIEIKERKLPTEKEILDRLRERLAVKVEHEVRALSEAERKLNVDRFVPIVESLVASEDGKRDLAAVCAAYLREHRPETRVSETPAAAEPARSDGPPPRRGGGSSQRRPRRGRRR
jgi:hypothetical protein